jgi:putative toxin-antitoxin system antitoxin component (TIGR02293 family)
MGLKHGSKEPAMSVIETESPSKTKARLFGNGKRTESKYLHMFKASPSERIAIMRKGIPAETLVITGQDMGMPKERLLAFLQFPRTTINRRISKKESLPPEFSERMIGLQKLIGQVESIMADSEVPQDFNAAHWVAQWLEQALPALGNAKPADYMDTVEGQELVASLLARMQSGAYA